MKPARRFDRTSPTTVISTVVVLAAMVIALLALLIFAPTSSAGPAEDCAAVRARDHQIYLNLIASLPPGAPIPPEIINPCLSAPSTTATAAPTTTVGLPGAQAPGGGPNVGANAPTNFPTYNGTPIVPVPTIEVPPIASESPASETGVGAFPNASASAVPSPTPTPGEGTTTDRGPGPVPATTSNSVPAPQESTPVVTPAGLGEGDGRDRYLDLVLVGAAAFTAGGIGVRGRRSPFGPRIPLNGRTPESVLSQTVGTLASPLMAYAKGGQSKITVTEPDGGRRTFFLIHDATSSHEAEIPVDVPPGGHMNVNPDGSVTVFDADGNPVSVVAAPWAYDANGNPVPTDYEVRDGDLIQKVYADEATAYPILADPPAKKVKAPDSVASKQVTKSSNTTSKPNSMTSRTSPQKPQSGGNTNLGNTSGGNKPAPNSMTPRTSPQKPQNSGNTSGDNTSGGNTSAPNSMTSRTSPQKPQNSGNTNTGNTSGATTSKPNSMTPRVTPQKPPTTGLWDSAWGFGESVVDTAVESVETLGDAWRNFLVVPVNDAAVDPFGLHPGLRAEPSPEHSPVEIAIAAFNIASTIPVLGGTAKGVSVVRAAVEDVLARGGTEAAARDAGTAVAKAEAAKAAGVGGIVDPSIPQLSISQSQLGTKIGKHAQDFGLDPRVASDRARVGERIAEIAASPDQVRQGAWNPNGGGGTDYLFYLQGDDVVVAKNDGVFVTVLKGGVNNGWFQGAKQR